jgi:hypothetical protein
MNTLGKIIGLCLVVYLLGMTLNYVNTNHIRVPNLPGTKAITQNIGDKSS